MKGMSIGVMMGGVDGCILWFFFSSAGGRIKRIFWDVWGARLWFPGWNGMGCSFNSLFVGSIRPSSGLLCRKLGSSVR
jgi:hypothetical protein